MVERRIKSRDAKNVIVNVRFTIKEFSTMDKAAYKMKTTLSEFIRLAVAEKIANSGD